MHQIGGCSPRQRQSRPPAACSPTVQSPRSRCSPLQGPRRRVGAVSPNKRAGRCHVWTGKGRARRSGPPTLVATASAEPLSSPAAAAPSCFSSAKTGAAGRAWLHCARDVRVREDQTKAFLYGQFAKQVAQSSVEQSDKNKIEAQLEQQGRCGKKGRHEEEQAKARRIAT